MLTHCLPFMPEIYNYIKIHCEEIDFTITSEVFSLNSLMAYRVLWIRLLFGMNLQNIMPL